MIDLKPLYETFAGQAAQPDETPSWQTELLATIDPERERKRNIQKAIAQASMALATTPGNFLQGLSTAAATGANSYLQGRDQSDEQRIKAMQMIQTAQQQDQQRRLGLLRDQLGLGMDMNRTEYGRNRDLVGDRRYEDETAYNRDRNARLDERMGRTEAIEARRIKQSIRRELADYEKTLRSDFNIQPADIPALVDQRKQELMTFYNLTDEQTPDAELALDAGPNVSQFDLMTGGTGEQSVLPVNPAPDPVLQQAREAIARGADPEAVRQRLIQNGYDASGL